MSNKKIKEFVFKGNLNIEKIIKEYARICIYYYKK